MEPNNPVTEDLHKELNKIAAQRILEPAYRRRKIMLWTIRTIISIALYFLFWDQTWVRWTLIVTIPLTIFGLIMILTVPRILQKRMDQIKRSLNELDNLTATRTE